MAKLRDGTRIYGSLVVDNNITSSGIGTFSSGIFNPGPVIIGTAISTGTKNQQLQLYGNVAVYSTNPTSGGYSDSSLAIGTTNPYQSPGDPTVKSDPLQGDYGTSAIIRDGVLALISNFNNPTPQDACRINIAHDAGNLTGIYPAYRARLYGNDSMSEPEFVFEKSGSNLSGNYNTQVGVATTSLPNLMGSFIWRSFDNVVNGFSDGIFIQSIQDAFIGQNGTAPSMYLAFHVRLPSDTDQYAISEVMRLASGASGNPGALLIGSACTTTTGTSNQLLQVGTGLTPAGAYISGFVGIATTNPAAKLHVFSASSGITPNSVANEAFFEGSGNSGITIGSGSANIGALRFGRSGNNSAGRVEYNHSTDSLQLSTLGIEALRIDSGQRVGIGSTIPTVNFDVLGNAKVSGAATITSNLTVSGGTITCGNVAATLLSGNTTTSITFANGLTTGTLTIAGAQTTGTFILGGTSGTGALTFGRSTLSQTINVGTGVAVAATSKIINVGTNGASGSNTLITLGSATVGAASTVFVPPQTRVGIGITLPTTTLQVSGNTLISNTSTVGTSTTVGVLQVGSPFPLPDFGLVGGFSNSLNGYLQVAVQNVSTATTAISEFMVINDVEVLSVFAVNSSNYDGTGQLTGAFGDSGATSLAAGIAGTTQNLIVGTANTSGALKLATNNIERVRLDPSGTVLIGVGNSVGTANLLVQVGSATTTRNAYISGNVGIGSTIPTSKLSIVGDASISGVVTATDFNALSDETLKTNIKTISDPIAKVLQLNGVTFNWKDNNEESVGVIAQDVEKVFPQLVHGLEPRTVSYNGLVGLLIECVKEQQKEIDALKKRFE
jgi:hypothetical protein